MTTTTDNLHPAAPQGHPTQAPPLPPDAVQLPEALTALPFGRLEAVRGTVLRLETPDRPQPPASATASPEQQAAALDAGPAAWLDVPTLGHRRYPLGDVPLQALPGHVVAIVYLRPPSKRPDQPNLLRLPTAAYNATTDALHHRVALDASPAGTRTAAYRSIIGSAVLAVPIPALISSAALSTHWPGTLIGLSAAALMAYYVTRQHQTVATTLCDRLTAIAAHLNPNRPQSASTR